MNKHVWIFPALLLMLLLMNAPAKATIASLTDDKPTITHYECVDENGDEACDDPPED